MSGGLALPKLGKKRGNRNKRKPLRSLVGLYTAVHERDDGCCVVCGATVEHGTIPHHEPPKSQGGKDQVEDLVILCGRCHHVRHFVADDKAVEQAVKKYLEVQYAGVV